MEIEFMQRVIKLAKQSVNQGGGPFAAVIVKDKQIIGEGCNQVSCDNDPTAHAEIIAIRNACKKLSSFQLTGCILYASSEPCPMCLSAVYWSRLDQVYFANSYQQAQSAGFDDQFIFNQLTLPHHKKTLRISQIKEPEILKNAADIFTLWNEKSDKISY
jgi:guanine deaminase